MTILFVSLSAGFTPVFGMDITKVRTIADKLEELIGRNINIVVENSMKPDAYLHPMGYIVITSGAMQFFQDDAEMAFIIGHEWAHIVKEHYKDEQDILSISKDISNPDKLKTQKLKKEIHADAYGLGVMKAVGYEPEVSLKVLAKLQQVRGQNGREGASSIQERMNALKEMIKR
jgi:predicted Zn-dependent protease